MRKNITVTDRNGQRQSLIRLFGYTEEDRKRVGLPPKKREKPITVKVPRE